MRKTEGNGRMLREIRSGIFVITTKTRFPSLKPPANIYVIAGEESLVFDAGYGLDSDVLYVNAHLEKIRKIFRTSPGGCKIKWIMPSHSHADHFSGAVKLKKMTGAEIILTRRMQKVLESKKAYMDTYREKKIGARGFKKHLSNLLDFIYALSVGMRLIKRADLLADENFGLEINGRQWRVMPTPGHSSDHISLYCEEEGILLGGDNVLRSVITWLGPPDSDLMEYENSLRKMISLPNLRMILPAHGSRISNPRARIRSILSHRKKRSADVLSIIRKNGKKGAGIRQIQDSLYPGGGFWMRFNSSGWIKLTISDLLEKGLIEKIRKDKKTFYVCLCNLDS